MKNNRKKFEQFAFIGAFGGMILLASAVMAMCSGKSYAANGDKVERFRATLPNWNDSVAAYDERNAPVADSLRNKIRAATSEEEIDYADFRRLIEISAGRDELLRKKAKADAAVRNYADSLANARTK